MIKKKKILFITGTRADFGKLHPLMDIVEKSNKFTCHIFVTGMHTLSKYGSTHQEVEKCIHKNIFIYKNQKDETEQEIILANTIHGLSQYIKNITPDMIVVHGDRIEALAGAIAGSFNNILVSHIEGGEISGTIDELIRHAVTKLSHIHFVANRKAKSRLIQLGELYNSISIIGSPDIDVMRKEELPTLKEVKNYYKIKFENYGILIFHPIATEQRGLKKQISTLTSALKESKKKYVVIFPNNDMGSEIIIKNYSKLKKNKNFRIFPSIKFQYFLTLLKNAEFIIGNSSAGIRESEVYGTPTIDIGTRQKNRTTNKNIKNIQCEKTRILNTIKKINQKRFAMKNNFGGIKNSDQKFIRTLSNKDTWKIPIQKQFIDRDKNR